LSTSVPALGGLQAALAGILWAATPEEIERTKLLYLGAAFAITWIAIAGYLFWLFRRQARLEDQLQKIRAQDNPEQPKLAADNKTPG
jgi:CcmD family protein